MSDLFGDFMARNSFSLYKRRIPGSTGFIYYAQFWDVEAKRYRSGRSVEKLRELLDMDSCSYSPTKKADARIIAQTWIAKNGIPTATKEQRLGMYCLSFWDWETSTYIRGLRLRGRTIGKEYVGNNYSYIKRYVVPKPLGDLHLSKITPGVIENFILDIKESTALSNTSCNAILCALGKPLAEAYRLGLIKENPLQRVAKLQKDTVVKGVLTSKEIKALFSTAWDDERVKVAAMLSFSCGLRLGEVLGLQRNAIAEDQLVIAGSYGKKEGLKTTKNGKPRIVYLPTAIKTALIKLASENPHNEPWVFWSGKKGVPINIRTIEKAFYDQLAKIGIGAESPKKNEPAKPGSRQARHISFHSLRHLYNTLLRGAIPDEVLRESTGHLTASMTEHYDHAEHDVRLKETAAAVKKRILPFLSPEMEKEKKARRVH
jgi:integrase